MNPLYLSTSTESLFCVYYPPSGKPLNQAIVHIPAFGDEMNKSRRMVAIQAREFAARGFSVMVVDLFGIGDSSGDFGDASWDIWLQNIDTAIGWLIKQEGVDSIALWGLRTGALLAMDYASGNRQKIDYVLCWQPVLNGDTFVTQFLRVRLAAAIMDNNAPREKTSDLKRQLLDGQALEVAGYWLSPNLLGPLLMLRAENLSLQGIKALAILEVVVNEDTPVAMSNSQFLVKLQENAIEASLTKVVGDSFWATQEISAVPDLIAQTNRRVEQWL